ncbi:MAG: hypothetical protein IJ960_02255 [Oscillospiraceae bacterium]|nr:hypothetical protein [Oscillospiraceae bacterium]
MKKYLLMALAAALLLTCCGKAPEPTETTLPTTESLPPETEPLPSFYLENSEMERGTGGAVKLFELDGTVTGMATLGGNLLVCEDGVRLYLLDPVTMKTLRSRELDMELRWDDESLVITEAGMAFYNSQTRTYLVLDTNLITLSSYVIDAELMTRPVITNSFEKICYGTREGLEVMTLADGTARRIREEHHPILSVDRLLFQDTMLCYTRQTPEGHRQTCFISTEDGSLLDAAAFTGSLYSLGDRFVCLMKLEHAFGDTCWLTTGPMNGPLERLDAQYNWDEALLLSDGRVVLQEKSSVGMTLYCYDLEQGLLLAKIVMPEQQAFLTLGGGDGERIWLSDGTGSQVYCWDTALSRVDSQRNELIPYAALSRPDELGMERVEKLAGIIGQRYDVTITFREEQNRVEGVNYDEYADTRPEQYALAVEELRQVLETLPQGLLYQLGKGADDRRVEICLVDGYDPERNTNPATGSIDVTGGNLIIRVNMCHDLQKIFLHELFHLMEVRIRTLTDGFEHWEQENPQGFSYLNSFEPVLSGAMKGSAYLKEGTNYFADAYGMISPREDRAQVFLYAMLEGEQNRFLSDTMQEKLSQISQTLRDVFHISEDVIPLWEQYLKTE